MKRTERAMLFVICLIFLIGVIVSQLLKIEAEFIFEETVYDWQMVKMMFLNMGILFALVYGAFTPPALKLFGLYVKEEKITRKELQLFLAIATIVSAFSTAILERKVFEHMQQITLPEGMILYLDESLERVYTEKVDSLNVGSGVTMMRKTDRRRVDLGYFKCERSKKECAQMVVKNKEQILERFNKAVPISKETVTK